MKSTLESLRVLFGGEPRRPSLGEISPEAQFIHVYKRSLRLERSVLEETEALHRASGKRHYWRTRRWAVLITVNLLFLLSGRFEAPILEGALTASRFFGIPVTELHAGLQVMLASGRIVADLLPGMTAILALWWLLGGRTFCAWVCPYHLLGEWAEKLHLRLAERKLVKDHPLHRGTRAALFGLFALLAMGTGYALFEMLNPLGILSRALAYGGVLALAWVALLLLFEIFYARRGWCRYLCPIGLTYGVVGAFSPLRVKYSLLYCHHEGECLKVCLVPHVLEHVKRGRAPAKEVYVGADCTRCGRCVDVCPTASLRFEFGKPWR